MFRQVLFKKPLLALSTDVNYQKLPQGNFDMTAALNNKKLLSLLFKQQIIQQSPQTCKLNILTQMHKMKLATLKKGHMFILRSCSV